MAFPRPALRTPVPPRVRAAVFAVGRRVYIAGAGGRSGTVMLVDGDESPLTSLSDGAEVMILAWLPGGAGTRYRVRVTDSGLEGWLPAGALRGTKVATSSPPAAPASVTSSAPERSEGSGRRFGQRF